MKKIFIIIIIIVVALWILVSGKDLIAKNIIYTGVRTLTGLKVDIKSMDIGILKTAVSIEGLKIFNPPDFKDRMMADIPEIYVDYELKAFLRGKVHLRELRLNLKEFIVVKNREGKVNLDSLKTIKASKKRSGEESGSKKPNLQIDTMDLKIGKVIYKDYYNTERPSIREFNVNISERYKNIDDPRKFANLIILKALMNTSISSLTGFDMGVLKDGLSDTIGATSKVVESAASTALKAGGEVANTAKEATGKAVDTIKNILPFGKEK